MNNYFQVFMIVLVILVIYDSFSSYRSATKPIDKPDNLIMLKTEREILYMTPDLLENYLFKLTKYLKNMKNFNNDCAETRYYLRESYLDLQDFLQQVESNNSLNKINYSDCEKMNLLSAPHFKDFCKNTLKIDIKDYIDRLREQLEVKSFNKYNSAVNRLSRSSDIDDIEINMPSAYSDESFESDTLREEMINIIIQIKLIILLLRRRVCKGANLNIINLVKGINNLYDSMCDDISINEDNAVNPANELLEQSLKYYSKYSNNTKNQLLENSKNSDNFSNFVGGNDVHNYKNKLSLSYISNNDSNNYYTEHETPIYEKVDINTRTKPSQWGYITQNNPLLKDSQTQFLESSQGCITRLSKKPQTKQTYDIAHIRETVKKQKVNLDTSSKMCLRGDYDYLDNPGGGGIEAFGGPMIFSQDGLGERGNYIGNNRVEMLKNEIKLPTIFDN